MLHYQETVGLGESVTYPEFKHLALHGPFSLLSPPSKPKLRSWDNQCGLSRIPSDSSVISVYALIVTHL